MHRKTIAWFSCQWRVSACQRFQWALGWQWGWNIFTLYGNWLHSYWVKKLIFSITRTGTRTFVGAFNHKFRSLSRFFTQFSDHLKHEAIMNIVTPTILRSSAQKMGNFYTTLVLSIDCHQALEFAMQKLNEYLSKSKPSIILVYIFRKKEVDFLSIISCYMNQTTDFKIW